MKHKLHTQVRLSTTLYYKQKPFSTKPKEFIYQHSQ